MSNATTPNIRVADLMTRSSLTVNQDDELVAALSTINLQCLSSMPVVDGDGRVCGILSVADLVNSAYNLECDLAVLGDVPKHCAKNLDRCNYGG